MFKMSWLKKVWIAALVWGCMGGALVPEQTSAAKIQPVIEWSQDYGISSEGKGVIATQDGGYLLTGGIREAEESHSEYSTQHAYIVKIDSSGQQQWHTTIAFEAFASTSATSAIQNKDGHYIIIGNTTPEDGEPLSHLFIAELDGQGQLLWKKIHADESMHNFPKTIVLSSDGGYVMTGYANNYGYGKAYILKTDHLGNEIWYKKFHYGDSQYFNDLLPAQDGGYVAVGALNTPDYSTGYEDATLAIKVNEQGEKVWDHIYSDPYTNRYAYAVTPSKAKGYLIASRKTVQQQNIQVLTQIGLDGQVQWEKSLDPSIVTDSFNNVVNTKDGYALLGSNSLGSYPNNRTEYSLLTLTADGIILDQARFKGAKLTGTGKAILTPDGGYLFPGTIQRELNYKLQAIKLLPFTSSPAPQQELQTLHFADNPLKLKVGSSAPNRLIATYADGSTEDISSLASYVSLNPNLASSNEVGRVTAIEAGSTTIQATYQGHTAELDVTVFSKDSDELDPISGLLQLDSSSYSILVGDSFDIHLQLTEYYPEYVNKDITANATYKSTHPDIAYIDANGNLIGKKLGETTIYAYYKGSYTSAKVQVVKARVSTQDASIVSPAS
ncbi:hypothetical protein J2Z69_001978 [Paenibacillus shirakamiensis]|uniref:BIG2 domain-containing protein n=1 Tax=Paenibacillus shirakamiensis TaxID=1265935 RepID=A0ABS4JIL4_9BACL|nr:hypothetical protein [Paenibacillus shirakamiensis]MBP2000935.1 hypothetical protein [Paenibacillus shirakamiensis]